MKEPAELFKPKMVCFFMPDPERDPDEFRKELIATGRCSPNDDIRLVRYLTKAEAAVWRRSGLDKTVSRRRFKYGLPAEFRSFRT
jgi:hypothetical protein